MNIIMNPHHIQKGKASKVSKVYLQDQTTTCTGYQNAIGKQKKN